ncbi:c-type cytochrome [Chloroflexota bacterium]
MKNTRKFVFAVYVILLLIWLLISPPQFLSDLLKSVDMSDPAAAGEILVRKYDCESCHSISGKGRPFGPSLESETERRDVLTMRKWLGDPTSMKPDTSMPDFNISADEIEAIIAYLTINDLTR